jgi:rfaE bifunctional protein nucleotidyltransferase chain/domain
MFDFEALSQAIARQTVLCVGDLMLDEFVYGEVSRVSPEAPAPVIAVQRSETNVGGAGNVARNIASLGGHCIFAGLVGEDEAGAKLKNDLAREQLIEAVLVSDASRPTTRQVRDVSGAGDTVAAALALSLAANADWETALRMANAAAAVAVGKKGTATVTPAELRRKILPHASLAAEEKIVPAGGDLDAHLAEWRRQGLRIGFTNGCFDILHPGHVKLMTAARGACDRLIVGLNSDASVKRLKGEGRPVQDEGARAEVLAALEAVDLVAIFEEDTPIELIAKVRPSVLVKGGDYTREQVVGHEIVEAAGGQVMLVDILPGHSTTSLVGRARGGKA